MLDIGFLTNLTFALDEKNESFNKFYLLFELSLLFITVLFIPFTAFALYLMWKFPQFHINLAILYSNLYFAYGFLTVGRLISFGEVYYCGDDKDCYVTQLFLVKPAYFAEFLKFTSLVAYFVASNWIIIERIWAIINLKGYENKKDYKFIIVLSLIQWITSAGGVWFALEGYVPIIICLFLAMFFTFASVLVFRYMDNKNKECYQLSKTVGNAYTLTERYQLAENNKTSPLIKAMINVNVVISSLILATVIFVFYSQTVVKKQISKMIFDILVTFHSPILFLSFILSIKKWRKVCKGLFRKPPVHKITPRSDTTVNSHSNNNKNNNQSFVMLQKSEADIYFQQLNNHWA